MTSHDPPKPAWAKRMSEFNKYYRAREDTNGLGYKWLYLQRISGWKRKAPALYEGLRWFPTTNYPILRWLYGIDDKPKSKEE